MYTKYYLLGTIALFFLSGCAGLPIKTNEYPDQKTKRTYDDEIRNHVIAIGKDGDLRDPLTGDEMDTEAQAAYLNNIVRKVKFYKDNNTEESELLIYIHGGLNTEGAALQRALEKYRLIKDSGKYPVFINWHSGPITTYWNHIWRIRQGEKEENILKKIISSPVYLLTDIGNSIVNTPKSWIVSGVHSIDSIKSIDRIEKTLHNQIDAHKRKDKVKIQYVKSNEKPSQIERAVQWLLTSPSKVITTPFTYTMAKPAWDVMLRRTSTLFYTQEDLKAPSLTQPPPPSNFQAPERESGSGALYQFLDKLEEEKTIDITLIGHSMGAIIVNDIVNLKPNLPYKNIIHMASADSIENLLNKVVPYIHADHVNFYSLYLHPDNENREVSWGGTVPSGSLLTWIDNMYTIPKTVLDKRSGRWDNMTRAIKLFSKEARENMQFTIFGIQKDKECTKDELKGLNCTAQEHGDFGDLPFWREEVWKGEHLSAQGE